MNRAPVAVVACVFVLLAESFFSWAAGADWQLRQDWEARADWQRGRDAASPPSGPPCFVPRDLKGPSYCVDGHLVSVRDLTPFDTCGDRAEPIPVVSYGYGSNWYYCEPLQRSKP